MSTTLDVYPGTMNLPSFAAIIDRSTVELHGFLGSVGIRARPPIHLRIQRRDDDSHVPVGLAAITSPTRRILGVVFSTRESHRRELSRVVTTLPGSPRRRTGGRWQRQRRCERELMPGSHQGLVRQLQKRNADRERATDGGSHPRKPMPPVVAKAC